MTNDNTFDSPDDGVVVGEPSPRQSVFRIPRTQAIPLFDPPPSFPPKGSVEAQSGVSDAVQEEGSEEEQSDLSAMYVFRRHWREPLLRILPTKYAPRWYLWVYALSIIVLAIAAGVYVSSQEDTVLMVGCAASVLLVAYPVIREVYRWKMRVVTIYRTKAGLRIVSREPDFVLLGFNGDGNGDDTKLEGSTSSKSHINWPNKLLFWGCGDLEIAGKVESGGSPPHFENIPHIKRVRQFLEGDL